MYQKIKAWSERNEKNLSIFLLLISLFTLVIVSGLFWQGFHDLDVGYNMAKLNGCEMLGLNLVDEMNNGIIMTAKDGYQQGMNKMLIAFVGIASMCLTAGYLVGYLVYNGGIR